MRVVLDTNVLVSLFVFADPRLAPIENALSAGDWIAFFRDDGWQEFVRVLGYPAFRLSADGQMEIINLARQRLRAWDGPPRRDFPLPRCSDRADQKFLELARDTGAAVLVTADKALLKLRRRDKLTGRFEIWAPAEAAARLTSA